MVHMTPLSRISPIGKGLDDLADLLVNITTSAMEKHTPLVDSSAPVVCPSPGTDLTPSNRALETEGPVNFPSNFSDFDFEGGPWPSAEVTSDIFDFLFDPAHFSNDFI